MKTRHDGDCTIYASLINGNPEDGICTCGYGHQLKRRGDYSEMYSKERLEKIEAESFHLNKSIDKLFEDSK